MTNKIIAQSARFRAVRTSRDRVRIKGANGKVEHASIIKSKLGEWNYYLNQVWASQDLITFIEATRRTLE